MTVTPTTDTGRDTASDTADSSRWAYQLLIWATIGVGAVTFALSFHGLYDLLLRVAKLPMPLAILGPLGVDGLTLCAIAATFLLRGAPGRVRAYVWLVFGVATGLSVAGNVVDATVRKLALSGVIAAAVAPILLALASHLVVVARRWMERYPVVAAVPAAEPEPTATGEPDEEHGAEPEQRRKPTSRQLRATARRRYLAGVPCSKIAADMTAAGSATSVKTIERWTKDLRQQTPPATDGPDVSEDVPAEPINGAPVALELTAN